MNILKDTIDHSLFHDFWIVISKDPERKTIRKNYMTGEVKTEIADFFKIIKPVNHLQIH